MGSLYPFSKLHFSQTLRRADEDNYFLLKGARVDGGVPSPLPKMMDFLSLVGEFFSQFQLHTMLRIGREGERERE